MPLNVFTLSFLQFPLTPSPLVPVNRSLHFSSNDDPEQLFILLSHPTISDYCPAPLLRVLLAPALGPGAAPLLTLPLTVLAPLPGEIIVGVTWALLLPREPLCQARLA